MFDFSKTNVSKDLTPDLILSKVDSFTIMTYYFGTFRVGRKYKSKFRNTTNLTTGFYYSKSGVLTYHDFATGERWNCFTFVEELFGISFRESLVKIASDFGILEGVNATVSQDFIKKVSLNKEEFTKSENLIQVSFSKWTKRALQWWKNYEITEEELTKKNVFLVNELFLNKSEIYNRGDFLRFAYYKKYKEDDIIKEGFKIYSPEDPRMKWLSSIPNSVPFGYEELPHLSDTVFVTKSKKDEITLNKMFTDVMSVQNESLNSFPEYIREDLKQNYKRIIIIFDNDEAGKNAAKLFSDLGYETFCIPDEFLKYNITDPSDYNRVLGELSLRNLFNQHGLCPNIKLT